MQIDANLHQAHTSNGRIHQKQMPWKMTFIMTIQKLPTDMVSELNPTVINQLWIHNYPLDFTSKPSAKLQAKVSERCCRQVCWATVQSAMQPVLWPLERRRIGMIYPTALKIPKFNHRREHQMLVERLTHQLKVLLHQKIFLNYQAYKIQIVV
jgi:hypothetical protein